MTGPMIPRERSDYSAIVDRPPLKLPGGARMIVWTIVNLEVWDISKPMARQVLPAPTGVPLLPDVPNWSWHEYGMRVGVWRFFDLYKKLGIAPTLSINARVCEDYPRVAQQAKDAGWEFMGHAYEQGPIHKEADQKAMIARSMGVIEKFTGKRPVGWLGPGLTQTLETPENLAEAGVKYIGDWVYDDEPTVIRTEKGPLVTLPYTVELNDIPMMLVQHHDSDHLLRRSIDSFDRLYAESKDRPKIMSIAIHPYISGQPFRIKYLEQIYDYVNKHEGVVHWNGEQMLELVPGPEQRDRKRERAAPRALPTVAATEARGRRRRLLSGSPDLLRRPQLSRSHQGNEGSRRARPAVLLSKAARCDRARWRARALSAVHLRFPVRGRTGRRARQRRARHRRGTGQQPDLGLCGRHRFDAPRPPARCARPETAVGSRQEFRCVGAVRADRAGAIPGISSVAQSRFRSMASSVSAATPAR